MIGKSSEVDSGEDLKISLGRVNVANKTGNHVDPVEVSGLCNCEVCVEEGGSLTKETERRVLRRGNMNKSGLDRRS